MSMSDDPRGYRRGQGNNQRPPVSPQGRDARQERQPAPPRGYTQSEGSADRSSGGRQPSFSAFRPEAYANADKRPANQDVGRGSAGQRPLSPSAEAYPRPAPERPAPQHTDSRDPYRSSADPYAPPQQQRDYNQDWRSSYQENTYEERTFKGYQDTPYDDSKQFVNIYDDPPAEAEAQEVHDRFFSPDPDPEPAPSRYRSVDYPEEGFDHRGVASAYDKPSAKRAPAAKERDEYDWDSFEQAPAPASLRPYQVPATAHDAHDDDMDADFFADEEEFEGEDFEEKKGGRAKLIAAVLVGAVVTGGGLGLLYTKSKTANSGEPPLLTADTREVKVAPPNKPTGMQFPGNTKLIQERLGSGEGEGSERSEGSEGGSGVTMASNTEQSASSGGDQPIMMTGGSLEERIQTALRDAKKETPPPAESTPVDQPQRVRTMTFSPDGNVVDAGMNSKVNRVTPPQQEIKPEAAPAPARYETASVDPQPTRPMRTATLPAREPTPQPQEAAQIPESAGGTGNFFVQVGARNDQAQAMSAFAAMQQKYASVLGNHSPSVRKVDLGEKGIWYRLRVGPFSSKEDADQLCDGLKTAGWKQCFSVKD